MLMRIATLILIVVLAAACQLQALDEQTGEITLTPFPTGNSEATEEATAEPLVSDDGEDLGIIAAAPPTDIVAFTPTGGAPGAPTQPAPSGRCTTTPNGQFDVNIRDQPGAQYSIGGVLRYGAYLDTYGRTNSGWYLVDLPGAAGSGWVSSSVVTLNGPCNLRIISETSGSPSSTPIPNPVAPTPTSRYLSSWPGGYVFITTAQVGNIPANTQVGIGSAYYDGSGWVYQIMARDGKVGEARDNQITWAPGVTPGAATPTPAFDPSWGYSFVTTDIGLGIPLGTRVRLSTMTWDGYVWVYQITADEQTYVDARESQLAYAPDTTPVGPTPTSALLNSGRSGFSYITTEAVSGIPANTLVSIGSAYFDGYGWMYQIATQDGKSGNARDSQLAYAPGVVSGQPTPGGPTAVECRAMANNALGVVNIRSGPGMNFAALNAFGTNDAVSVLARTDNGWYRVRMYAFGNPFEGFAPAGEIALYGDCETLTVIPAANYQATPAVQELPTDVSPGDVVIPEGMCTVIAVNSSPNIYESNRADSAVIGVLRPGPWLTASARDGKGWYRVTLFSGGLGWIDGSQVQVNGLGGACEELPVL